MKYLVFGSMNIDHTYRVEEIVTPGKTILAQTEEIALGGKGFNQAVALARASKDAKIYFAGSLGEDGSIVLEALRKEGIDIRYIKHSKYSTGKALIQVDQRGNNAIVVGPGSNDDIDKNYIDEVLSSFGIGDVLIMQNEIPLGSYIAKRAKQKEMTIVYNPSPFDKRAMAVDLNNVDYLFINELEGKEMTGTDVEEEMLDILKEKYKDLKIVLTIGERGSLYIADHEKTIYQKAYEVPVLDTTGAGDTFTGYFIAQMRDVKKALHYAAAASAIAVSQKGAFSSIPVLKDVEDKLTSLHFK